MLAKIRSFFAIFSQFVSGYSTAKKEVRETIPITTASEGEVIERGLPELVQTLRALSRTNPRVAALANGIRADFVGRGIWFSTKERQLKEKIDKILETIGPKDESLETIQAQTISELLYAGNVFFVFLNDNGKPKILPLPFEDLDIEATLPGFQNYLGVLLDNRGPRFYKFRTFKKPVPAEEVFHFYLPRYPGQILGEPLLAPSLESLVLLSKLEDAEVRRSIAASGLYGVLKTNDADLAASPHHRTIRPGSLLVLTPGEEFSSVSLPQSSDPQKRIHDLLLTQIAASVGVSLFWLDRDPSRANYSSLREDHLRSQRFFSPLQQAYGRQLFTKLFEFLRKIGVLKEKVDFVVLPDRMRYVNPKDEVAADVQALEAGLTSVTEILAANGGDLEDFLEIRRREIEKLLDLEAYERKLRQEKGLVEEKETTKEEEKERTQEKILFSPVFNIEKEKEKIEERDSQEKIAKILKTQDGYEIQYK